MAHFNLPSNVIREARVKILINYKAVNELLARDPYASNDELRHEGSNYDRITRSMWFRNAKREHGDEIHAFFKYVITTKIASHVQAKLVNRNNGLVSKVNDLQEDIALLERDLENAQEEITNNKKQIGYLNVCNKKLNKEIKEQNNAIDTLSTLVNKVNDALADTKSALAKTESMLGETTIKLEETSTMLIETRKELKEEKAAHAQTRAAHAETREILEQTREQVAQLHSMLDGKDPQIVIREIYHNSVLERAAKRKAIRENLHNISAYALQNSAKISADAETMLEDKDLLSILCDDLMYLHDYVQKAREELRSIKMEEFNSYLLMYKNIQSTIKQRLEELTFHLTHK